MSPAWFAIWVSLGSVFPVPVQALSPQDGVCDRTAEIRDAIVSAVTGVTDCAEITETQLGQITTLTLFAVSITALAADDLVGLSGLVTLNLAYTGLTVLPPTVFDDLTSLDNLWLNNNQLQTLPAGIFTGLTGLDDLRLASNPGFPFGPVAEAGPSFFVSTDREVTLRGSGGSDPWGRSVTYAWTQSDSSGVVVSLDGDTTATPSLTAPAVEQETVFRFMLTVTAVNPGGVAPPGTTTAGDSATDSTPVRVAAAVPVSVYFHQAMYVATEGGRAATVAIRLDQIPRRSVSIPLKAVPAAGADAADYSIPASVTFGFVDRIKYVTVTATDDSVDDDGESLTFSFGDSLPVAVARGSPSSVTVELADNDEPVGVRISGLSVTSDPGTDSVYVSGNTLEVTATFSDTVTVFGRPQLALSVGTSITELLGRAERNAGYVRGSGTTKLVFAYGVVEGDDDPDGVSVASGSLDLNGGSVQDSDSTDAVLAHGGLAVQPGHRVDALAPTLGEAFVDGSGLTLRYSEPLDENSVPPPTAFSVSVGGASRTVTDVGVSGKLVDVTLATAVRPGEEASVGYTLPATGGIRDKVGLAATAFSKQSATNYTLPTVSIAAVDPNVYEGMDVDFKLTRNGPTIRSLQATVRVQDSGDVLLGTRGDKNVTFAADNSTAWLTLKTHDNHDYEAHATISATVIGGAYHVSETAGTASVTVSDNDLPEIDVTLSAPDSVAEEVDTFVVQVSARTVSDEEPHGSLSVRLRSSDSTAEAGSDYLSVSETVRFLPADFTRIEEGGDGRYVAAASRAVTIFDDSIQEDDETFALELTRSYVIGDDVNLPSDPLVVTIVDTDALTPPGRVSGLSVTGGNAQLALSWSAVGGATGYKVQWKSGTETFADAATDARQYVVSSGTTTAHTITGLTNGTPYTVRVIATNSAGDGPPSDVVSATTVAADPATTNPALPPPQDVNAVPLLPGEIRLSWWRNPNAESRDLVDRHQYRYRVRDASTWTVDWTTVNQTMLPGTIEIRNYNSVLLKDLTAGTAYEFQVRSVDKDGGTSAVVTALGTAVGRQTIWIEADSRPVEEGEPLRFTLSRDQPHGRLMVIVRIRETGDMLPPEGRGRGGAWHEQVYFGDGNATIPLVLETVDDRGGPEPDSVVTVEVMPYPLHPDNPNNEDLYEVHPELRTATKTVTAAESERNTAATGTPAISGTPQVGEELTASTSGISDADGLDNASFGYQWIRTGADIGGATGATYTPVAADEGKKLKVRVSFTDDAGNEERLTSAATDAVAARPEPLTASFEGMPAEHRGQGSFSFRVAFSEGIKVSYKTVRDASFRVTGGDVTRARRVDKRRDLWKIIVAPDSNEAVRIRLPETTDCGASGAICTGDGRPLSHSLSATVAGPVGIAVADARVEEGDGAVLAFLVTLSRAASGTLAVDYATEDGSAHAGDDYTAASGRLKFRAGQSSKKIKVGVLDDSHDEGEETLTLRLSNASSGRLTDGEATGTIENHDPLPRALLARFGRAAAVHVVEHVEERLQAPREPGFRGRFAGRELRRGMERDVALNFLQQLSGGAGAGSMGAGPMGAGGGGPLSGAPAAGTAALGMPGPAGGGGRLAAGGGGPMGGAMPMGGAPGAMGMAAGPMGGGSGPDGGFNGGGLLRMGLGGGDVLTGSDFALGRETRHGGILSFWSRGAQSHFSGREGALSLGGDVRTTMFGADYAKGPLVTGLSLSHSRGLGEYTGVAGGQVASSVTGLYPWLGYKATERVMVWGVTGYGSGGMMLTPRGGPALESGLSMAMAAAGTRGELVAGGASAFELAFKADALWVGTSIDGVDGPAGRLKATEAAVTRFRTGLEGSRHYTLAGRLSLKPSVEVGLRHDGGDAETGAGMDVGGGLVVSDASTGLAVDVRVRTLLVHQDEDFSERGVSLSVSYNPTPSTPLGFVARVAPSWGGQATSGAQALWGRETMGGMADGGFASGNRLDGEVGYGLPVGSRFVGTPRVGFATSEYGRDYRLGYSLGLLDRQDLKLELGVDAQRRESSFRNGVDRQLLGRAAVRW